MKQSCVWISGWGELPAAFNPAVTYARLGQESTLLSALDFFAPGEIHNVHSPTLPASRLIEALEKRGRRPLLIGWSLGGTLALEVAATRPDLISGAVIISCAPKFVDDEPTTSTQAGVWWRPQKAAEVIALRNRLERADGAALSAFYRKSGRRDKSSSGSIVEVLAEYKEALIPGLEYLLQFDGSRLLRGLTLPLLVVHGAEDAIAVLQASPPETPGEMPPQEGRTPNATPRASEQDRRSSSKRQQTPVCPPVIVLSRAGHAIPYSHPRELGLIIRMYFDGITET